MLKWRHPQEEALVYEVARALKWVNKSSDRLGPTWFPVLNRLIPGGGAGVQAALRKERDVVIREAKALWEQNHDEASQRVFAFLQDQVRDKPQWHTAVHLHISRQWVNGDTRILAARRITARLLLRKRRP